MNNQSRIDPMPMSIGPQPTNLPTAGAAIQTRADQVAVLQARLAEQRAEANREGQRIKQQAEERLLYAAAPVIESILPHLDAMELAIATLRNQGHRSVADGLEMALHGLVTSLRSHGAEKIAPKPAEAFDPEKHDAIQVVSTDAADGSIVECLQPGYVLHDRLIRPARVVVNRHA